MNGTRSTLSRNIFQTVNYVLLSVLAAGTLYPFIRVLIISLTPNSELVKVGSSILYFPTRLAFYSYEMLFASNTIPRAYLVTIFRVFVGTGSSVIVSLLLAYPLSRRYFGGKRIILFLMVFTMMFNGGMIPTYMIIRSYGLLDRIWVLVLPLLVNAFNVIIMRNYFMTIPEGLEESAKMDGANDFRVLISIMMPTAKPMIAAITLFYAVSFWNEFFEAIIYLNNTKLYPLQVILREILFQSAAEEALNFDEKKAATLSVRMASIIVTTLPVLVIYPFLQKHFTKGILLGSVKQ